MTFKHVKFEDSPIMRSLEKVAKEKGMVKEEPIVKKAEKKQDLLPTHNLDLNLVKLCEGLRKAGMDKHADELETNFVNYKRAQTLYEAHTEKGEDLINAAHPKGSHKLEGVEGDEATVEDILDQHLKIVEKVNKMPTGKLSSASAITAVMLALGQAVAPKESEEQLYNEMNTILSQLPTQIGAVNARVKKYGDSDWATIDKAKADELARNVSSAAAVRPFNRASLLALKKEWSTYSSWAADTGAFENSVWHSSEHNDQSTTIWNNNVGPYASNVTTALWKIETRLKKLETIEFMKQEGTYTAPAQGGGGTGQAQLGQIDIVADPILGQASTLVSKLTAYKSIGVVSRNPRAMQWIDAEIAAIRNIMNRFNSASDTGQVETIRASLKQEMDQAQAEVDDFYKKVTAAGGK